MNGKIFIVLLLMAVPVIGLNSCLSNKGPIDIHNSRISLDWEGVYAGTIPAASAPGINVRMKLNKDQSFELRYEYNDRPGGPYNMTGSFKWNDDGNTIILNIKDWPPYYRVAQNMLIQLDTSGKPITGELADYYILKKEL